MERTITILIGGCSFFIGDLAYADLQRYLGRIERHFQEEEDAKDIIADLEGRIAELLFSATCSGKLVVTQQMVQNVISCIGEYEDEEAPQHVESESGQTRADDSVAQRKLFRSSKDGKLGGVCYGLAKYFDIDVIYVRLFFVLTLAILLYILLLILMPNAETEEQYRQMEGKHDGIEKMWLMFDTYTDNLTDRVRSKALWLRIVIFIALGGSIFFMTFDVVKSIVLAVIVAFFCHAKKRSQKVLCIVLFPIVLFYLSFIMFPVINAFYSIQHFIHCNF